MPSVVKCEPNHQQERTGSRTGGNTGGSGQQESEKKEGKGGCLPFNVYSASTRFGVELSNRLWFLYWLLVSMCMNFTVSHQAES